MCAQVLNIHLYSVSSLEFLIPGKGLPTFNLVNTVFEENLGFLKRSENTSLIPAGQLYTL